MVHKKAFAVALFTILFFTLSGSARSESVVNKVNRDDKNFSGIWVHKVKTSGQPMYSVISRVKVVVMEKMFHMSYLDGGELDFTFDGTTLWEKIPSEKKAVRLEPSSPAERPFWKMPPDVGPLVLLNTAGTERIAGRPCRVIRIDGLYKAGAVSVTYWVDERRDVLLKKEYELVINGKVFMREAFESTEITYGGPVPKDVFDVTVPSGWSESSRKDLVSQFLKTKF